MVGVNGECVVADVLRIDGSFLWSYFVGKLQLDAGVFKTTCVFLAEFEHGRVWC